MKKSVICVVEIIVLAIICCGCLSQNAFPHSIPEMTSEAMPDALQEGYTRMESGGTHYYNSGGQIIARSEPSSSFPAEHDDEGDFELGKYRPIYYSLSISYMELVGKEVYLEWEQSRTWEESQNECAAVAFVLCFSISKEDFIKATEDTRDRWASIGYKPEDGSAYELYPVDLIYTFDNEKINEYFRWENSIYAHEVGLPNPLRGEFEESVIHDRGKTFVSQVWHDYPNWTENPAWREHKFWEYLPFGKERDSQRLLPP